MNKIGFIGLGTMGAPMAMNLLNAGYELYFYSRREPVVQQFREAGAIPVGNCAEVAEAADVIIAIVPADREVEQVLVSDTGVIAGGGPGKLVVDMSTISPITVHWVAARLETAGMSMLDAPVSGGHSGAKAGTLAIMAGGSEDDFTRVLQSSGRRNFSSRAARRWANHQAGESNVVWRHHDIDWRGDVGSQSNRSRPEPSRGRGFRFERQLHDAGGTSQIPARRSI